MTGKAYQQHLPHALEGIWYQIGGCLGGSLNHCRAIRGESDHGALAVADHPIKSVAVETKRHGVNACCAGHFEQDPRVDRLP